MGRAHVPLLLFLFFLLWYRRRLGHLRRNKNTSKRSDRAIRTFFGVQSGSSHQARLVWTSEIPQVGPKPEGGGLWGSPDVRHVGLQHPGPIQKPSPASALEPSTHSFWHDRLTGHSPTRIHCDMTIEKPNPALKLVGLLVHKSYLHNPPLLPHLHRPLHTTTPPPARMGKKTNTEKTRA